MKRHRDALGIQEGANNVRAIARSLVGAAEEAMGEGVGAEQDAAVRMIVHRLARICRVDLVSYGYDTETLADTFTILMQECKNRAEEGRPGKATVLDNGVVMLQSAGLTEAPESVEG